jgi:[ribosomal protein S5]-alanine N-acetyltransferase
MFDFTRFPILETERLRLREMVESDAEAIFAIRGDYEVTKLNIGAAYTDITQAADLIQGMADGYIMREDVRWGITLKPDDTVIGMVGFNYWNRMNNRGSIGFDLNRAYWRRGIMREAVAAVIEFGFGEMLLNRIEADASIYNSASIGLLAALGFQQEGVQRDQYYEDGAYHDLVLFGLLKREWVSR